MEEIEMTKEEYKKHIDHRLILLTTFRDRFKNENEKSINDNEYGDFYRCAKDISIMIVRFFVSELGYKLSKNNELTEISKKGNDEEAAERIEDFKIQRFDFNKLKDSNVKTVFLKDLEVKGLGRFLN